MTSKPFVTTAAVHTLERFPDFPPRDDMQNPIHLVRPAIQAALSAHFGNPESTLVLGEVPVATEVPGTRAGVRIPDLLVAFNVDAAGIIARGGYSIDLVGKPPDFALEVASPNTGRRDYTAKRRDYEHFGIAEYWRFDPTGGRWHDAPLAGDRLVSGSYQPFDIEWPEEDKGRGYSPALGLYLCWEEGHLRFYDPRQGRYLPTYDDQVARAVLAEQRADREARRADQAMEELRRLRQQLRNQD